MVGAMVWIARSSFPDEAVERLRSICRRLTMADILPGASESSVSDLDLFMVGGPSSAVLFPLPFHRASSSSIFLSCRSALSRTCCTSGEVEFARGSA